MQQAITLVKVDPVLCRHMASLGLNELNSQDTPYSQDTAYLALTGELWGVYCEEFGEN